MSRNRPSRDHKAERQHRKESRAAKNEAARQQRNQDAQDFSKGQGRWNKDK